ncbi:hypothetical protein LY56_03263 [Roseinatronobacter thiooxidans]|uniref:Uncharacterized protein n=1 Tax=Roseinatronobacter thiooxidans TaxID=121821 RepID=A0A2W7Q7T6_9RHOB|nr:hypothetical protein [Roseinatronobacter thiooxidans]PZX37029.1 hypothetical protein LY56_03263 [Roseinatronobacter thiooxidans]
MKHILNIKNAFIHQSKLLVLGAAFGALNLSHALAEDAPVENGPLSHLELVMVQSGDELRSISLGIGSGMDVQIESGYINADGEFVEIQADEKMEFHQGIGSYSSVVVFGE